MLPLTTIQFTAICWDSVIVSFYCVSCRIRKEKQIKYNARLLFIVFFTKQDAVIVGQASLNSSNELLISSPRSDDPHSVNQPTRFQLIFSIKETWIKSIRIWCGTNEPDMIANNRPAQNVVAMAADYLNFKCDSFFLLSFFPSSLRITSHDKFRLGLLKYYIFFLRLCRKGKDVRTGVEFSTPPPDCLYVTSVVRNHFFSCNSVLRASASQSYDCTGKWCIIYAAKLMSRVYVLLDYISTKHRK